MLTDSEIIKALECCSDNFGKTCEGMHCPMIAECQVDTNALEKSALALINRQKAEIEKNEDIIRLADKTIEKQSAEIERLQKHTEEVIANCRRFTEANDKANNQRFLEAIDVVKSEAYREFAHMVIDKAQEGIICAMDIPDYVVELTKSNE